MSLELKEWLARFGVVELLDAFLENEIDLDAARDLNEQDLRELGLAMGPRKKLLRAIAALNEVQTKANQSGSREPPLLRQADIEALGERRQVTVLFADISGYTKLSGELGAEATHSMLSAYFDTADKIVESFGGSVDKHIGDSVMAVFGAPVSHGNDPERAVRAAAAIHDAMQEVSQTVGREIRVHIGVASGQVVASGVGASEEYTVTGESVNLASRLTDEAGPTETVISETVMQAVETTCRLEDVGNLTLRGIAKPVKAFRVVELVNLATRSASRPFVGRQAELGQLNSVLKTTASTHTGHVIYVRGEAGIGKTRITEEIERMGVLQGFDTHRALVLDFGAGRGQDAIRSLVRSLLSVASLSSEEELLSVIQTTLNANLISKDQVVFLTDLLDLPQLPDNRSLYSAMDNTRRNQGKCETIASIVRQKSQAHKLLLIVEDVHWAEAIVLSQLAELARAVSETPAILIMTSRLEGDQIDEAWKGAIGSTPIINLDLRPLRRADAITLASDFFDASDKFAKSCVERADGNPLFLEQLLRGAETAAQDSVPGSIQSIVQARVDALASVDKLAIQAAAILGQRFVLEALQYVIEDASYKCEQLVKRHLIRSDGEAFLFAHALVRDGVYSSLLTITRSKLHLRAADWYQERDLQLCAQHLDLARDDRAAKAYLDAARNQIEALHFETAIKLCLRGLELARDADELCDLNWALGDALLNTRATEQAIERFERAAECAPDKSRRTKALTGLAAAFRIADRQAPAFEALEEAQSLATAEDLVSELAYIHYLRGNLCFPLGRIDECMEEHERSLQLAEEIQSPQAQARALSGLADAHYLRGHMLTACERFTACVELCRQHGFGQLEVANLHMIGWSRIHLMEFREALEDAVAAEALATEVRNDRSIMFGKKLTGIMHYYLGDLDRSAAYLEESIALAKSMSSSNMQAQGLRQLAMVHRRLGDLDAARECASRAIAAVREVGMTFIGPTVLATYAWVCDDSEKRRSVLEEAEAILDSGCVAHNQLWFADIAIDDALSRGEWDPAKRYADRLERETASQPLTWSSFMVDRARLLIRVGNGQKDKATVAKLRALKQQAERAGLESSIQMLDMALAE